MGRIEDIYNKNKDIQEIQRISYMPYKLEIATEIFLRICAGLFGSKIELTDIFETIMIRLIIWVHNDDRDYGDYELNNLNAIGLIGRTGSRKTFMFQALQKYMEIDDIKYLRFGKMLPFKFKIFSARNICGEFQENGYDAINKYASYNIICIDDLGAEPGDVLHYGNRLNIIETLIEERYLAKKMTHFSSNLKPEMIKEKYGDRVYSRIMQTTNILELKDKDFRISDLKL